MLLRVLSATVGASLLCLLEVGCGTQVQSVANPPQVSFKAQAFQPPQNCLPCHQRQFDELRGAVKSGYRNVSPLFNGLESAGNLASGGLLRPVYGDSKVVLPDGTLLNTNMYSSPILTETRQVQAGFCFTCHNANVEVLGEDPIKREVPQLAGLGTCNPAPPAGSSVFNLNCSGRCETTRWWMRTEIRYCRPCLEEIPRGALCHRWGLRELPATSATLKTGRT